MNNIRDWCISRQIWWGHRIPAWYCEECGEIIVSEENPTACSKCKSGNIRQETDVLDTWFSSGLWPFSTMGWPEETKALRKFYPTNVLITGFDILFFWVARMMMMGIKFMHDVPFHDVYLHALVRDEQGQKMSKSKGNIVDPIVEMDKYGADAFRFALAAFAAMGRDVRISDKRIQGYRFFINKIWNAGKFVLSNIEGFDPRSVPVDAGSLSLADAWILTELNKAIRSTRSALEEYRFNDAADSLYQFTWHTFCDWYIELSKPLLNTEAAPYTKWTLCHVYRSILELLHPMIPFVTEEIWQNLPGSSEKSIVIARYPKEDSELNFPEKARKMGYIIDIISGVRSIRGETNIPPSTQLDIVLRMKSKEIEEAVSEYGFFIRDLARVKSIGLIPEGAPRPKHCALAVTGEAEVYVPLEGVIDIDKEKDRLDKQIAKLEKELEGKRKKLSNKDFLEKANPEVVEEQVRIKDELELKLGKLLKARELLEG